MAAVPPHKDDPDGFDIVLAQAPVENGQGARVLRARPGRLEAGEVRPLRDGVPLAPGGEIVHLEPRDGAPGIYDVRVDHVLPARPACSKGGPAQVATTAYRQNWDRTFGVN